MKNSIFVLKKTDLPWFIYKEIEQQYIDLYELNNLDQEYNIYASVSDLNENEALRNELEKEERNKNIDLRKFVRQGVSFITLLKWNKNIQMAQIQIKSNWDNQLNPNELKDVRNLHSS